MLDKKEIKIIEDLIEQGKTNYQIGKERGHSPNTIQPIREAMKKTRQRQKKEKDAYVKSPIDRLQGMTKEIDALIYSKQLDDRQRKQWEKQMEPLREILRVEVDDRIATERADAVQKRDQECNRHLEQSYVKKEVATNLERTIQERDKSLIDLRKLNAEKDEKIKKNSI